MTKGIPGHKGNREGGGDKLRTYRMVFPKKAGSRHFPVEGCSGRVATWTAMRVHFWNQHLQETVVIMEEGNLPLPRFTLCNMLVPWRSLNRSHKITEQCKKRVDQKQQHLAVEEARVAI